MTKKHTFNDGYQVENGKTEIIGGKIACEEFPLVILDEQWRARLSTAFFAALCTADDGGAR